MTSLATEPVDDFTKPLPQAADRHAHRRYIWFPRQVRAGRWSTRANVCACKFWPGRLAHRYR